eukprot:jgi/Psemu1/287433/fgenesh1_pg.191_\
MTCNRRTSDTNCTSNSNYEKKRHQWRRRRLHGTPCFAVVLWVTNAILPLLQKNCDGFAVNHSPYTVPFPQQRRQNELHHRQTGFLVTENFRFAAAPAAAAAAATTEPDSSISSIPTIDDDGDRDGKTGGRAKFSTESTNFSLSLPSSKSRRRKLSWRFLRQQIFFWRKGEGANTAVDKTSRTLNFAYEYDVIDFPIQTTANDPVKFGRTTGILLIHPIGVGIARWYYQRLVHSLVTKHASIAMDGTKIQDDNNQQRNNHRVIVVVPDLLGSGSACNATVSKATMKENDGQTTSNGKGEEMAKTFPLFNISDWTDQLEALMSSMENASEIDQWCVVANGGCSPIALQLAERKQAAQTSNEIPTAGAPVSNLILSSNETTNDPKKVAKSFQTLSGIAGNLFWWYACRNEGAFIQTFSEKNLIADPFNLGPFWRPNCYQTAISYKGKGKYATFSFLAGTLQDGCLLSLDAVKETSLQVDIIKGADIRRNRAKSWFWQKPKQKKKERETDEITSRTSNSNSDNNEENGDSVSTALSTEEKSYETFRDYIERNGNGGREIVIGGRISLAHEDSDGYADAILKFLFST